MTTIKPRRGYLLIGALVGVAVVAALAFALSRSGSGGTTPSNGQLVIAEFQGQADATTEAFEVNEGWQIEWQNEGPRFRFSITGDVDYGTVINQEGPGSGVSSPVGSGTFRLEVVAEGPWTIRIVQRPDTGAQG